VAAVPAQVSSSQAFAPQAAVPAQVSSSQASAVPAASPARVAAAPAQVASPARPAAGQERLGVNRTSEPRRSASGPIPASAWNDPGGRILPNLTQASANPQINLHDDSRCGTASLLGANVMNGPAATANFLDNTARHGVNISPQAQADLRDTAARVRTGQATYEDLNRAQETLYQSGRQGRGVFARRGLRDGELLNVAAHGGQARLQYLGPPHDLATGSFPGILDRLHNGESATLRVRSSPGSHHGDHFVTFGRDASGRPYVYNPSPGQGDATVTRDMHYDSRHPTRYSPTFRSELVRYEDRVAPDRAADTARGTPEQPPRVLIMGPPPAPPAGP
jgi:hypothetical protein